MKIVKILSLICFLTIGMAAQTGASIAGKVNQNNKPVVKDWVMLIFENDSQKRLQTETDQDGRFKFENLSDGKYYVLAGCDYCWRDAVRQEVLIESGKSVDIEIKLPDSINEQVTVSAGENKTIEQVSK